MTPHDLLELFRRDTKDEVEPYLWSDDDIYAYMDEAQKEFAWRTKYFLDHTTFGAVQVPVTGTITGAPTLTFADADPDTITRSSGSWVTDGFVADMALTVASTSSNDGSYTVDTVTATVITLVSTDALAAEGPTSTYTVTGALAASGDIAFTNIDRIYDIRRAKLASRSSGLRVLTVEQFERTGYAADDYGLSTSSGTAWEDETGTPAVLLTDYERNVYRLVPKPTVNDTLQLSVYRIPVTDLVNGATAFEITEVEYQRDILLWMKHQAYLKQDADTFDEALSAQNQLRFASRVESANRRLGRLRHPVGTTKYGGL